MDKHGNMDEVEFKAIGDHYGGIWCDCIQQIIEKVTPQHLAVYCERKYKPFHQPQEDEVGARYAYFLKTVKEIVTYGEKDEVVKEKNICADFGEFYHRPIETLQSTLKAITKIAEFEKRTPHSVALEVIECDPAEAPEVKMATADRGEQQRQIPTSRRYQQGTGGDLRRLT